MFETLENGWKGNVKKMLGYYPPFRFGRGNPFPTPGCPGKEWRPG
jgi:hypothetical protein